MTGIILAVSVVGGTGLLFGILLATASFVFKVDTDERAEQILEALPGANCGACGYAGCSAYAEAIVKNGAPVNCCSVGKAPVAQRLSEIMGVDAGEVVEMVARVACGGDCNSAIYKYEYEGVRECTAEVRLGGGAKECPSGCLGLGSCTRVCKFGAISIQNGIAVVDEEKCTACGQCLKICPKGIIHFIPKKFNQWVVCQNPETGRSVNQYCKAGCIGCGICEKNCPFDAIHVEDNYAVIDYNKCKNCGLCARKCPRHAIHLRENKNSNG